MTKCNVLSWMGQKKTHWITIKQIWAVAGQLSWLECGANNAKVAGSIPISATVNKSESTMGFSS